MAIDLIKHLVFTEKSTRLFENKQLIFHVDPRLTKPQIKKLIEEVYQIKVIAVNTHRPPHKKRRFRANTGFKASYKRAIVTMQTIPDPLKIN